MPQAAGWLLPKLGRAHHPWELTPSRTSWLPTAPLCQPSTQTQPCFTPPCLSLGPKGEVQLRPEDGGWDMPGRCLGGSKQGLEKVFLPLCLACWALRLGCHVSCRDMLVLGAQAFQVACGARDT